MEKILKVGGVVFVVIVVLAAAVGIYIVSAVWKLNSSGKAYADRTIPMLTLNWNPEELKSRASMELLSQLKESDLNKLYGTFRKLGRMTRYNGATGQAQLKLSFTQEPITATYDATAEFENGPAKMNMLLIKRNGAWQINGFSVESPIFLQ